MPGRTWAVLPAAGGRPAGPHAARAVRQARRHHHLPARQGCGGGCGYVCAGGHRHGAAAPAGRGVCYRAPQLHGAAGLTGLLDACRARGDDLRPGLARDIGATLARVLPAWPGTGNNPTLPRGQIHADLFPDNVFSAMARCQASSTSISPAPTGMPTIWPSPSMHGVLTPRTVSCPRGRQP